MQFDIRRVAAFVRSAGTEDLLDRVTIYRDGMEPAALDLMEGELDRRGVTRGAIADHDAARRESALFTPEGVALRCSFCDRPAEVHARGWLRIVWQRVPIAPRLFAYCAEHRRDRPREHDDDAS